VTGGSAFLLCVDEYTNGVGAFDPAAGDSSFADYFAAPEGKVDITLRFMDDGTVMDYTLPHGTYFIIVHEEEPVDSYIDEACTQLYEGGNQLDKLTLYVK